MNDGLIHSLISVVVSAVTGAVGFFVGKRRREAETGSVEIENLKEIISIHTDTIKYLQEQISELRNEVEKLRNENESLQKFKK
jgi:TolA-binding protein